MVTLNQIIDAFQQQVETSFPSIYSKADVQGLLADLKATCDERLPKVTAGTIGAEQVEEIVKAVKNAISDADANDYLDNSSAEFSLHYNEIQLDSVDFDMDSLARDLENEIRDAIVDNIPAPSEEVTA